MRKVTFILCAITIAAGMTGCGKQITGSNVKHLDRSPNSLTLTAAALQGPGQSGSSKGASANNEEQISRSFIKLADSTITLPIPYQQMTQDGWALTDAALAATDIIPGNMEDGFLYKGNTLIKITAGNCDEKSKPMSECTILSIQFTKDDIRDMDMQIELPEGLLISLDTRPSDIKTIYGEETGNSRHDSSDIRFYDYALSKDESFSFGFYDYEPYSIEYLTYSNYKPLNTRRQLIQDQDSQSFDPPTPEVAAYQVPSELGTDITSRIVEFGGDLYQFPIPVSALIANGWHLAADDPGKIAPGESANIMLTRGLDTIYDFAYNYSSVPTTRNNLFIDTMSSGYEYEGMALPGQIKAGSTRTQVEQVLEGTNFSFTAEYNSGVDEYRVTIPGSTRFVCIWVESDTNLVSAVYVSMETNVTE